MNSRRSKCLVMCSSTSDRHYTDTSAFGLVASDIGLSWPGRSGEIVRSGARTGAQWADPRRAITARSSWQSNFGPAVYQTEYAGISLAPRRTKREPERSAGGHARLGSHRALRSVATARVLLRDLTDALSAAASRAQF